MVAVVVEMEGVDGGRVEGGGRGGGVCGAEGVGDVGGRRGVEGVEGVEGVFGVSISANHRKGRRNIQWEMSRMEEMPVDLGLWGAADVLALRGGVRRGVVLWGVP